MRLFTLLLLLLGSAPGFAQIIWEKQFGTSYRQHFLHTTLEPDADHFVTVRSEPDHRGQIGVVLRWFAHPSAAPVDSLRLAAARERTLRYELAHTDGAGTIHLLTTTHDPDHRTHRWTLHRITRQSHEQLFTYPWSEDAQQYRAAALLPLADGGWLVSDHLLTSGRFNQARLLRFDAGGQPVWTRRFTDNTTDNRAWFRALAETSTHLYAAGRRGGAEYLIELDPTTGATVREFRFDAELEPPLRIHELYADPGGETTLLLAGHDAGTTFGTVGATGIVLHPNPLEGIPLGFAPPAGAGHPHLLTRRNDFKHVYRHALGEDLAVTTTETLTYDSLGGAAHSWQYGFPRYGLRSGCVYGAPRGNFTSDTTRHELTVYAPDNSVRTAALGYSYTSTNEYPNALFRRGDRLYLAYRRGNVYFTAYGPTHTYDELLETDWNGANARRVLSVRVAQDYSHYADAADYELLDDGSWLRLRPVVQNGYVLDHLAPDFQTRWTSDTLTLRNRPTLNLDFDARWVRVRNLETEWQFDRATGTAAPPVDRGFQLPDPELLPWITPLGADRYLLTDVQQVDTLVHTWMYVLDQTGTRTDSLLLERTAAYGQNVRGLPFEGGYLVFVEDYERAGNRTRRRLLQLDADFRLLRQTEYPGDRPLHPKTRAVRSPHGIWFDRDLFWWTPDGIVSARPPELGAFAELLPTGVTGEYWTLGQVYRNNSYDLQLRRLGLPERVRASDEVPQTADPTVFPNPGTGLFRWSMDERNDPAIGFRVLDARGVVHLDRRLSNRSDEPTAVLFALPDAAVGLYILEVRCASGARRTTLFAVQ